MILFLDFDGVLHPEPAFVKDMLSQLPLVEEILRHQASMAWLVAELANGEPDKTVVVTHHFPHKNSCSPKWSNDSVTAIFWLQAAQ